MELTKTEVYAFLASHRYAVVATVSPAGLPQSALVGVAVTPDLEVLFDTIDTSRKVVNLRSRPQIALVIGWENEQSVQMEGVADEPAGPELERLKALYFEAWPECREHQSWAGITYVRVRPHWLRFSDFNRSDEAVRELVI